MKVKSVGATAVALGAVGSVIPFATPTVGAQSLPGADSAPTLKAAAAAAADAADPQFCETNPVVCGAVVVLSLLAAANSGANGTQAPPTTLVVP